MARSPNGRKHILTKNLGPYLLDEFRKAISRIPKNTTYDPPHTNTRHPFNILIDIISSFLGSFSNDDSDPILMTATMRISWELRLIYQTILNLSVLESIDLYRKYSQPSTDLQSTVNLVTYPENGKDGMEIKGKNIVYEWKTDGASGAALRNVNFEFPPNKVIAIVGENGYACSFILLTVELENQPFSIFSLLMNNQRLVHYT